MIILILLCYNCVLFEKVIRQVIIIKTSKVFVFIKFRESDHPDGCRGLEGMIPKLHSTKLIEKALLI